MIRRIKKNGGDFRSGRCLFGKPALVCFFLLACLCANSGCDLDWKERAHKQYLEGLKMEGADDFRSARSCFEAALKINPFHIMANRHLAEILETRFFEDGMAKVYYERYLDLGPKDSTDAARVKRILTTLEKLLSGNMENPINATEDILWAIKKKYKKLFVERLHFAMVSDMVQRGITVDHYYSIWQKRAIGSNYKFIYRDIAWYRDGAKAVVLMKIKNREGKEEIREMHYALSASGLWELSGETLPQQESSDDEEAAE